MLRLAVFVTCSCALVLGLLACTGGADKEFISIGTGSQGGVYYPVGGNIADLVNRNTESHALSASHSTSKGSVENINLVLAGELDFGMAQSDRQYQAVNGLAEWKGEPRNDLRAVCSLHPEVITLVAKAEIETPQDLTGKVVSLGAPGSGQRQNALEVLTALGIDPETDITAESLSPNEAPQLLQDGRIDAFFYTVGHPTGVITECTTGNVPVRIVPLTGLESLLEKYPYYQATEIAAGIYPNAVDGDQAVSSIGMLTTLVTSAKVSEDTVYHVTKAIFENLDRFRDMHPTLATLSAERMLVGLSAPIHAGAERYYREAGLLDSADATAE